VYEPDLTDIDKLKLMEELNSDDSFINIFKKNITKDIIKEAKDRYNPHINEENHVVWERYGLTGSGKSIGMMSLTEEIHPTLKVDNIFFHNQQILEALPKLKRPDFIIRDENVDFAQYGSGSNRIKMQLEAITQTLRKRCISFIFISTQPANFSTTQYIFRAIDKDRKRRITRFGVKDPITNKYLGAVYVKVMPEENPFWKLYTQHKEEFMQKIIEMDFTQGKPQYQKLIDILMQELNIHIYKSKKERKSYISQRFTNLTRAELEEISTMYEIQLREKQLTDNAEQLTEDSKDSTTIGNSLPSE
jgi:hypothetical protein